MQGAGWIVVRNVLVPVSGTMVIQDNWIEHQRIGAAASHFDMPWGNNDASSHLFRVNLRIE